MRIIGIENIICDYYFWNNDIYINGGGTVSNILINLDFLGIPCKLIGYCGNDEQGKWIYHTLQQTKINIEDVIFTEKRTKCFYIKNQKTTSYCPLCNTKKEKYPNLPKESILSKIKPDDILLLKDCSKTNEFFMNHLKNKILIDISAIKTFFYMSNEKIEQFLFYPFKIMNIKEETLIFLQKKLDLTTPEIIEKMQTELILITKGKKGADFFYQKKKYHYSVKEPLEEIETNGCGDAFFSNVIFKILKNSNQKELDFHEIFESGQQKVKIVLQNIGARNHIIPNQKIEPIEGCICNKFKQK